MPSTTGAVYVHTAIVFNTHMIYRWHLFYSWIACQLEAGTPIITFAVEVKFQIRDQFRIPQPNYMGQCT